jgi:6-phosphogluconolactonase (cycloisomerase 2 family)
VLYAVNEVEDGALQSFILSPDGRLSTAIDTVSTGGNGPAFAMPLSTGQVAAVNFGGGNGKVIQTTDPLTFATTAPTITFPALAGGQSHPHMVLENGNELLIPDLGADTVYRLSQNGSPDNWKITGQIPQPKGSGPRHIAVNNGFLYTIHEQTSTLTSQKLPPISSSNSASVPTVISSFDITPRNPPAGAKFAAAEILFPPPTKSFPTPLIYVSNRNIAANPDPNGDTIAIYEAIKDGSLELANPGVFTGLQQVRGMEFSDEVNGEQYLVASGVVGDAGVVVMRRVDGGKGLAVVARNREVGNRTSFVWVTQQ